MVSVTSSCNVILCKGWQTKASVLLWVVMLVPVGALLNSAGLWQFACYINHFWGLLKIIRFPSVLRENPPVLPRIGFRVTCQEAEC